MYICERYTSLNKWTHLDRNKFFLLFLGFFFYIYYHPLNISLNFMRLFTGIAFIIKVTDEPFKIKVTRKRWFLYVILIIIFIDY